MEITGRLTTDAQVRTTKSKKELVSFTIAVNDGYKAKDGEWKDLTEYFSCTYWLSTKVADRLTKGCIVSVSGRVFLDQYKSKDGTQYSSLGVHVQSIRIFGATQKIAKQQPATTTSTPEATDDLPF